ncbi:hypothetical protein UJ101_01952 [Flavobacteriaceae bacterium UJ101]|nr:hypothetical protein UJ101_01952 [Flavobacteriaceae bacterium UJ101]
MLKKKKKKIRGWLFENRYQLLLISILLVMFDSLLFNDVTFYQMYIWPLNMLFFGINASNVITSKRRKYFYVLLVLSFLAPFLWFLFAEHLLFVRCMLLIYTLLYWITLVNIVTGIFKSKKVTFNMILGAFCGYLLLGLIATFSNMALLTYMPDAIDGLAYFNDYVVNQRQDDIFVDIMYYSFITMTSIGYGDFLPIVPDSKMLAVFIGISGQFYMTVIVALIIGKYLNRK